MPALDPQFDVLTLTWQLTIAVSVIALLWSATCTLPASGGHPGRIIVAYNVAALTGWPAAILAFAAPSWHAAEILTALCAASVAVIVRETRIVLAEPYGREDDDGGDEGSGEDEDPDLPPGGGLTIDWDAFERDAHQAWREHTARPAVYV